MLGIVVLVVVALLFVFPPIREWLVENIKSFSDGLLLNLLRGTSRFGRELTDDGRAEQKNWRQQRLRNLRGLALITKKAAGKDNQDKQS